MMPQSRAFPGASAFLKLALSATLLMLSSLLGAQPRGVDIPAAVRMERPSPADVLAPLCAFLASEGAGYVNGQIFHQRGAELSLYSQPRPVKMVHQQYGWSPETIAEVGMPSLKNNFFEMGDSRAVHPGTPLE